MTKLTPNINTALFSLTSEQQIRGSKSKDIESISLKEIEAQFNKLENINLSNNRHKQELLKLFPSYLLEECNGEDWDLFLSMSRFDKLHNTFVAGCFDTQQGFKLISYKWRKKSGGKWRTKAGTHPNNTLFMRIHDEEHIIYIVEGHRDALTAILMGLNIIMVPYAGFNLRNATFLQNEIKKRNLVFLVEDKPAYICMKKIAEELTDFAQSITLLALGDINEKIDLSDFVTKFKNIKEAINGLQN